MTKPGLSIPAEDMVVSERVRLGNGVVVLVSEIEDMFTGTNTMLASIEDTPPRWFQARAPKGITDEVERAR